eukprot:7553473-Heterocapsa_arctica.AAC.1
MRDLGAPGPFSRWRSRGACARRRIACIAMSRMLSVAGRFFRLAGVSGGAGACLPRSASLRM